MSPADGTRMGDAVMDRSGALRRLLLKIGVAWIAGLGFALAQPITGRVSLAGEPLAGAEVRLEGPVNRQGEERPQLEAQWTDAEGRFAFQTAPEGPLSLQVVGPGAAREEVPLERFAARERIEIALSEGGTAELLVLTETGAPLAAARLLCDLSCIATSDEEGRLLVTGVPLRGLSAVLLAEGYLPAQVALSSGGAVQRVRLIAGETLRVRVLSSAGEPLAGVRVAPVYTTASLYAPENRALRPAVTGEDGVALIRGLKRGSGLFVRAAAPGFVPGASEIVQVQAEAAPLEILLGPGEDLSVSVFDGATGAPLLAEVFVLPLYEGEIDLGLSAEASAEARRSAVDEQGRARLSGLPRGPHLVIARAPGAIAQADLVFLGEGPRAQITFQLEADFEPKLDFVPWENDLSAAFARAEDQDLPVWCSLTMDGERANDRLAEAHFRDPDIIRVARRMPCILANAFGPGGLPSPPELRHELTPEGGSTRYGPVRPEAFQAHERWLVPAYFGADIIVPFQLSLSADGSIQGERPFYPTERALRDWLLLSLLRKAPAEALTLARTRYPRLLQRLCAESTRSMAAKDLLALAHAGISDAAALFGAIETLGWPSAERAAFVQAILPALLPAPAESLRPFLTDAHPLVRRRAVEALEGASERPGVVRALTPLLRDPDPEVAFAAGQALGIEDTGVAVTLSRLSDPAWAPVAAMAARTYQTETLFGLDEILLGGDSAAAQAVYAALIARAPEDDQAYEPIYRAAEAPGLAGARALQALARLPRSLTLDPKPVLAKAFEDPSPLKRAAAIHWAAACGEPIPENLVLDADPEVRLTFAFKTALAKPSKLAEQVLEEALSSGASRPRVLAWLQALPESPLAPEDHLAQVFAAARRAREKAMNSADD